MTREKSSPRVFEPQSIREFSTVCYQVLYENNDEAKKYLKLVEKSYCSPYSTLGENEKAYMQTYISEAFHLAKRMKKINKRDFIRKERVEFNKKISLEEATINKNRYLRELKGIKDDEIEKTKNIYGRATRILPPLTSSTSLAISYAYLNIPKEPAALIAGITGLATYATFKTLCSRKTKKTIKDCCQAQSETNKYYAERARQIEGEYSDELLKIEDDRENEENKHASRGIRNLNKAWVFYGIDDKKVDFDLKNVKVITLASFPYIK